MNRVDDRDILEFVRDSLNRVEYSPMRLALRLAAMRRHQDQALAFRPIQNGMGEIFLAPVYWKTSVIVLPVM